MALTAVDCCNQKNDRRPDIRGHGAHPGRVVSREATHDTKDEISTVLDHVVDNHDDYRNDDAEYNFKGKIPSLLRFAWDEGRTIRVQDLGQGAEDANQGPGNTNTSTGVNLGVDIAIHVAVPPCLHLVCRPDKGVGKIEEVQNNEPGGEAGRGKIAIARMPDQGRDADKEGKHGQNREGNSLGRHLQVKRILFHRLPSVPRLANAAGRQSRLKGEGECGARESGRQNLWDEDGSGSLISVSD